MNILWTIIIGFVAGVIAKFIHPGPNEPQGFIVTTLLGIAGAFVATYLGQQLGWYRPGEGAGLIGAGGRALVGVGLGGPLARAPPAARVTAPPRPHSPCRKSSERALAPASR